MVHARSLLRLSAGCVLAAAALAAPAAAQSPPASLNPSPYARPTTYEPDSRPAPPSSANAGYLGSGNREATMTSGIDPRVNVNVTGPTISTTQTAPSQSGGMPFMPMMGGGYGYGHGGGFGAAGPGIGYGFALEGMASLQQAQGQYWKDIQQAKMGREQALQANLDTARKRVEFEKWYESQLDNAVKQRDRERTTDLDWARKDPPRTEIWSGRTLNVLLRSVLAAPAPTRGPYISLDPETLRGINLTDGTTRGNLALAKDEGKIAWPEALDDAYFDEPRDRFSKNFAQAMKAANDGEQPDRTLLRQLRDDLTTLENRLNDKASDLPPSGFIEARRLITRLRDNVKGLSDARLVRSNTNWRGSVRTMSDLVNHLMRNGLQFGPVASPGDDAAYTAMYFALRSYERELVQHGLASAGGQ
ncbi:MAG: hypothetical protein U0736_19575 [Gemmataceae bacterium]